LDWTHLVITINDSGAFHGRTITKFVKVTI